MKRNVVREKSYSFAVDIVVLHRGCIRGRERTLGMQMMRAGTSIGANVEEALAAQSRRDFLSKMSIACKEARECHYWLRLLADAQVVEPSVLAPLTARADELVRLLTAIVRTSRNPRPRKP